MRTSAEIEATAPSDEEVHEAMELLHTRFGDPPFLKRLGDLRVIVITFDRCPDLVLAVSYFLLKQRI